MNPQEREHAAEQWLDEALASYRVAVPRPGLETRVLAGLQARAERQQRRWFFAFASCAAVLLAMLIGSWPRSKTDTPANIAVQTPPAKTDTVKPVTTTVTPAQKANIQLVHERRAFPRNSNNRTPLVLADIKQEHFPVPRPFSEQEQLLRIYLRQTPRKELALIAARQQSALHIEDLSISPIEIKELITKEIKN